VVSRKDIVSQVCRSSNACVLRNWKSLEGEVDLLIKRQNLQKVKNFLVKRYGRLGIVEDGHHTGIYIENENLKLDFQVGVVGWKEIPLIDTLNIKCKKVKGLRVLPDNMYIAHVISHCLMDKAKITKKYQFLFKVGRGDLEEALNLVKIPNFVRRKVKDKIISGETDLSFERKLAILFFLLNPENIVKIFKNTYFLRNIVSTLHPLRFAPLVVVPVPSSKALGEASAEIKNFVVKDKIRIFSFKTHLLSFKTSVARKRGNLVVVLCRPADLRKCSRRVSPFKPASILAFGPIRKFKNAVLFGKNTRKHFFSEVME